MQPQLFDLPMPHEAPTRPAATKLDAESEALLERYQERRLAGGAAARTVTREASQLRSLAREAAAGGTATLRPLFAEPGSVAAVLLAPGTPIAWSTGRVRLAAVQRFARACGHAVGILDSSAFL